MLTTHKQCKNILFQTKLSWYVILHHPIYSVNFILSFFLVCRVCHINLKYISQCSAWKSTFGLSGCSCRSSQIKQNIKKCRHIFNYHMFPSAHRTAGLLRQPKPWAFANFSLLDQGHSCQLWGAIVKGGRDEPKIEVISVLCQADHLHFPVVRPAIPI